MRGCSWPRILTHGSRPAAPTHPGRTVVAIPVKDEAEQIAPCLQALRNQMVQPDAVLLLMNNCTDLSETVARRMAPSMPWTLHIVCHRFPPNQANAGHARRLAMGLASGHAGEGGVLLTTDADTIVPPNWIERNLLALAAGADAVCGRIALDPAEAAQIPAALHHDDALECELTDLLDEIAHRLDPDPADPWPRHAEAAGASLAVKIAAFHAVGGVPPFPSGEDHALVAALARQDARIRHDPGIIVTVSGRTDGRAAGGMAATIRRRMERQDELTDERLEPATDAFRRADFRRRVRAAWRQHGIGAPQDLVADIAIPASILTHLLREPHFGAAWADIEAISPMLKRRRVRFADLPKQIAYARVLLAEAEAVAPVRPCSPQGSPIPRPGPWQASLRADSVNGGR
jgi:GT2 family glycosyltransferase